MLSPNGNSVPSPIFLHSKLLLFTYQDLGVCVFGLVLDSVCLTGVLCPNQELFWKQTAYPRGTTGCLPQDLVTVSANKAMALWALNAAGLGVPSPGRVLKEPWFSPRGGLCVALKISIA